MIVNFVFENNTLAFDKQMPSAPRRKDFVKYHGTSYIVKNVALILQDDTQPFWRVWLKRTYSEE